MVFRGEWAVSGLGEGGPKVAEEAPRMRER